MEASVMLAKQRVGVSASEARLEALIKERLEPGADRERIDERIWDLFGEDWCVMFTDLSGFSRGVERFGIIHFLQTIHEAQRILLPIIEEHDGILLKVEGDSFLVIFRKAPKAVKASIAMMKELREYDKDKADEDKVLLCVGIGYGRMLRIGDADVFGAQVNAASKLGEDTAEAWQILLTAEAKEAAAEIEGCSFVKIDAVPPGAKGAFLARYDGN
jgi:class 3 adenylate cyclase